MRKTRAKVVDKIEYRNGVKFICRYVNGILIARLAYSDFQKHSKGIIK